MLEWINKLQAGEPIMQPSATASTAGGYAATAGEIHCIHLACHALHSMNPLEISDSSSCPVNIGK